MSLNKYLQGWQAGAEHAHRPAATCLPDDADWCRGYAAGRAAYESARREEERQTRCPVCGGRRRREYLVGSTATDDDAPPCQTCHGTGQKPAPAGEE